MAASYRKRVLIVDDDERELIALEALLENQGYETATAWGGQEALELLRSSVFDLVLLDDCLPKKASDRILQVIQQMAVQPLVGVLQTGCVSEDALDRALRLAAHCSLDKRTHDQIAGSLRECLSHTGPLAKRPSLGA